MHVDPEVLAIADQFESAITPQMLEPHRAPVKACLLLAAAHEAQQNGAPEHLVMGLLAEATRIAVGWTQAHMTAQNTGAWPYGGPAPEMEENPLDILERQMQEGQTHD